MKFPETHKTVISKQPPSINTLLIEAQQNWLFIFSRHAVDSVISHCKVYLRKAKKEFVSGRGRLQGRGKQTRRPVFSVQQVLSS